MSGKFIITGPDNNNMVRSFTKDNLKFTYQNGNFILTTGEGIVYRFEQKEYSTETTTGSENETETYISSWYLSSIQLVNGTLIRFSYVTNNTKNWAEKKQRTPLIKPVK
ncbi:hypothetical protein A4D02_32085 [Niastella koreensis]|uniref:Lipocalin-like domain-containing protein n=1 Tax=Niastella koreensis TaxID=354356 RepID=A0ABX3NXW4_9BACT|nr:hypothetical protein [Niastella koreensis]OQP46196.1 hypothetical protein A4D02_32085 [Niastella koreensis]